MNSSNTPSISNKSLLLSTLAALFMAIILYFFIILPAEFNIDPSGIGKRLGLTKLSENTVTNTSSEFEKSAANDAHQLIQLPHREDEINITIPAGKGIEYKFTLNQYGRLKYDWKTTDQSKLYFDFHGEPKGDKTGFFESYTIATAKQMNGTMTMPFDGVHGWYWKNSTDSDIVVNLITTGQYSVKGLKK